MEDIRIFINHYYVEVILGLAISYVILLSYIIIHHRSMRKLRNKYNHLVQGQDGKNLEEVLSNIQRNISNIHMDMSSMNKDIDDIATKLSFAIRKVGFMRYNAFDDMGSELSFSLALLDDFKNGFVISSIYGRENTVSYGKPIRNGQSNIPLSAEEILVIDRAIKGEPQ